MTAMPVVQITSLNIARELRKKLLSTKPIESYSAKYVEFAVRTTLSSVLEDVSLVSAVVALLFAVTFFIEGQGQAARRQLERYSPLGRMLAQKILKEYEWMQTQKCSETGVLELIRKKNAELKKIRNCGI